jgi:hypothetical protein
VVNWYFEGCDLLWLFELLVRNYREIHPFKYLQPLNELYHLYRLNSLIVGTWISELVYPYVGDDNQGEYFSLSVVSIRVSRFKRSRATS